jgi:phosphoribosyl-AMP cyclohydrolase
MAAESPSISHAPISAREVEQGMSFRPRFDQAGLIPVIVSDARSGEVLMFAWMNAEALAKTLETGVGYFWSRSRAKLWQKGKESGNRLKVVELRIDCDQDALWLRVEVLGNGVACHTGARTCFYRRLPIGDAAGEVYLQPTDDFPPT